MPATSVKQQQAAGIALAAERGELPQSKLRGASKEMAKSMYSSELHKFAHTAHKGLPRKKALVGMNTSGTTNSVGYPTPKACLNLEDAGAAILDQILAEDGEDESAEKSSAQTILQAVERLRTSLPGATPEQSHDLTIIRSAANSMARSNTPAPTGLNWKEFFGDLNPNQ